MNIEDSRTKIVFKSNYEGKTYYQIGISHKLPNGTYESGYLSARFPKDTNLENKTKIMIVSGWLDFYIKDKKTIPFVFINKYEIVDSNLNSENKDKKYDDIEICEELSDDDLPF